MKDRIMKLSSENISLHLIQKAETYTPEFSRSLDTRGEVLETVV
jgi:hypothetical protein